MYHISRRSWHFRLLQIAGVEPSYTEQMTKSYYWSLVRPLAVLWLLFVSCLIGSAYCVNALLGYPIMGPIAERYTPLEPGLCLWLFAFSGIWFLNLATSYFAVPRRWFRERCGMSEDISLR